MAVYKVNPDGSLKYKNTVIFSAEGNIPNKVINERYTESMNIGGNTTGTATIKEIINPKTNEYDKVATDSEGNEYHYDRKGSLLYAVAAGEDKDSKASKDFTALVKSNIRKLEEEQRRIAEEQEKKKAEQRAERLNNLSDNLSNGSYGTGANFRRDDFINDWVAAGGEHYNFTGNDAQTVATLLKGGKSLDEIVAIMKRQNSGNNGNRGNNGNSGSSYSGSGYSSGYVNNTGNSFYDAGANGWAPGAAGSGQVWQSGSLDPYNHNNWTVAPGITGSMSSYMANNYGSSGGGSGGGSVRY